MIDNIQILWYNSVIGGKCNENINKGTLCIKTYD